MRTLAESEQFIQTFSCIHLLFYKQPVYKQLALGWKIAKQISELNLLSISSNKNYRLKKSGVFLCNKCKIAVTPKIRQNPAVSKELLGKF